MNTKITSYYIPDNKNISEGPIYTLYINNNKNLDLTSILQDNNTILNNIIKPYKENMILEKSDYDKLVNLSKQINLLINTIKKYQEEENKNIQELLRLNTESNNLLANIFSERKI